MKEGRLELIYRNICKASIRIFSIGYKDKEELAKDCASWQLSTEVHHHIKRKWRPYLKTDDASTKTLGLARRQKVHESVIIVSTVQKLYLANKQKVINFYDKFQRPSEIIYTSFGHYQENNANVNPKVEKNSTWQYGNWSTLITYSKCVH